MNLFARFRRLIPAPPLQAGTVQSLNADGTTTVTLPGGGALRAMGQPVAVGNNAFVQDGKVIGEAPNLPLTEITV